MELNAIAENLGLEIEEVIELVDLYINTTSSDFEELKAAINTKDAEKIHKYAHSIKGSSGNLGLTEFYELAKEIDERARFNPLEGLDNLVDDFAVKYEKLVHQFNQIV